jgi:hypothetical protein
MTTEEGAAKKLQGVAGYEGEERMREECWLISSSLVV